MVFPQGAGSGGAALRSPPHDDNVYDELRAICDEHGIFLRHEALAIGHTDRTLARAVRDKVVHRIRHGSYVHRSRWDALTQEQKHVLRARAVLRTARTALVLSHTTAVLLHGAPTWDLPLVDVHATRMDGRSGRRAAGVAQHRGRLGPGDSTEVGDLCVTSATRTALDLSTLFDVEHCLVVFDHLLHHGATSKPELHRGAEAMKHWADTLTMDLVIRLADGRRESVGETRTGHMLWRHSLPAPQPNYKIFDSAGKLVARVDFAWPEFGVFLEFDGKEKYLKHLREGESVVDAVRREKRREEQICRATGWRCIRITWADLYAPERTCAHIASVLRGGPVYA